MAKEYYTLQVVYYQHDCSAADGEPADGAYPFADLSANNAYTTSSTDTFYVEINTEDGSLAAQGFAEGNVYYSSAGQNGSESCQYATFGTKQTTSLDSNNVPLAAADGHLYIGVSDFAPVGSASDQYYWIDQNGADNSDNTTANCTCKPIIACSADCNSGEVANSAAITTVWVKEGLWHDYGIVDHMDCLCEWRCNSDGGCEQHVVGGANDIDSCLHGAGSQALCLSGGSCDDTTYGPCVASTEPPVIGGDPHVTTFFGEKFDM
jgi:hypothetical protein